MLIDAIKKIMNNKQLAQDMAEAGHKFVEENFSKEKFVENLTNIYESILQ